MLKLFQMEECPSCVRVRKVMAQMNLEFETAYVPRLGSERKQMQTLGLESMEVPLLVDGDKKIQGADAIIEHLGKRGFADPTYGLTRVLNGVGFADAIPAVREALAAEGFGILTEIDVKATLKKKLDVDLGTYLILGACNPPLAHQALLAEPALGLFLPCNVVVTDDSDGNAVVSAIDPKQMFKLVDNPRIEEVAGDVRKKLSKALAAI